MKLDNLESYETEQHSAARAQRLAQEIAFGPVVFQTTRLMLRFGIFELLADAGDEGVSLEEIARHTGLSRYAAQVLLESSLTARTVLLKNNHWMLAKTGWFLLNDPMARINLDFVHDVNYLGLFDLQEALLEGRPAGLRRLGPWATIYEGLSSLPQEVQRSWFAFDHFYSDQSFDAALEIVFGKGGGESGNGSGGPRSLLDVGGNTGRWAGRCVAHSSRVEVTIVDLPQQLGLMRKAVAGLPGADRIHGYGADLLDPTAKLPSGFEAIWMSQFLDCFSEPQVVSILRRAAEAMNPRTRLYIMETFWDRQRRETAAFCLAQTSVYFTAMANGNSKMYLSADMERCVAEAGLEIVEIHDGLGLGHSIMVCARR